MRAGDKPRRAVISVFDKTGLFEFARGIVRAGFELISTGGTARALGEAGIAVREVSDLTGFGELFDGRIKTLHPRVHAGILARRERPDDMAAIASYGIEPIELVCVNLYPFEKAVAEGARGEAALEMIDVGGPALLRAAAKNWPSVVPVPAPRFYDEVLREIEGSGEVGEALRRRLAAETFHLTSGYDAAIAAALEAEEAAGAEKGPREFPPTLVLRLDRALVLRYGENPHQRAAFYRYRPLGPGLPGGLGGARQLSGKALSYTNLLDLDAAFGLALELPPAGACIVKHATPCGAAAFANSAKEAFERALSADPLSAYGGVVGLNLPCDAGTATAMTEPAIFLECIVAPRFEPEALEILTRRPRWGKSVRLVEVARPPEQEKDTALEVRSVRGGILAQEADRAVASAEPLLPRTGAASRGIAPELERDLRTAICCAKHARSNAIAVVRGGALVGIGAGQTSRVGSVRIALEKAKERARGAALASDAFFPFADSVELAVAAGIAAIAEPGGARRDAEVIRACEERGIALFFTGLRHFRH